MLSPAVIGNANILDGIRWLDLAYLWIVEN